jgi:hypothetical protein
MNSKKNQADEEKLAEENKPAKIKSTTIQSAINNYTSFPNLSNINKDDIQHQIRYDIKFEINHLGNVEILCHSPDYDIAFSNNLLNILGFETTHPQLSILNIKKRKFFRNYLFHYSENIAFLFDTLFHALKENDQKLYNSSKYFDYIKHIINTVLKINTINVWNDFSFNFDNKTTWPINTKWTKYFDPKNFFEFTNHLENLTLFKNIVSTPHSTNSSNNEIFANRGLTISYFMLHSLFKEQPILNKTITSTIPPHINHPNDVFLIYSDIIIPNIVNETVMPLLAITQAKKDTLHNNTIKHEIINLQYRKCDTRPKIDTIQIYITSLTGKPVKFLRGPTFIELHFIKTFQ